MGTKVKVLIVDDHQIIIDGIRAALYDSPVQLSFSEALNGNSALDLLAAQNIDVVLLDINLPDINGIEVCKRIKQCYPSVKVIMISMYNEKHILAELLEIGIDGYLIKNSDRHEYAEAIQSVHSNKNYFHPDVKALLDEISAQNGAGNLKELPRITDREREILKHTANGLSSKEIGEILHISQFTVEKHKRNMLVKFNLKNTVDLVSFGYRNNLIF